ncbi:MAG TPA: arginase [Planctomycetota bacterium]|nr:arginase [Planctomycetota bacterium]
MLQQQQTVRLVGVPMDLGAGRRGVDMGPSAIRVAGIGPGLRALGFRVEDDGDVGVPAPESRDPGPPNAKYLDTIWHVCNRLRLRVRRSLEQGEVPLVMGGDHSIAIGTVAGVAEHYRASDQQVGLIWIDAHADMNTPQSSPTGNIHGMPLAVLLGMGESRLVEMGGFSPKVDKRHVCLVGIRNLDEQEKTLVRSSGIHAFTMRDLDERGMRAVAAEAIAAASDGTAGFHVSFDLDGMDPRDVPGTGTPVKGGIDWREANLLMEMVSDSGRMTSLEITELNPIFDVRNQSGEVAVDLVLSAFGKRIL